MGNITNLATTGNYATEADGLKVSFNFAIDNQSTKLKRIDGGSVVSNNRHLADFHLPEDDGPSEENLRIHMNLTRGREIELVTAIVKAVAALDEKFTQDEVTSTDLQEL